MASSSELKMSADDARTVATFRDFLRIRTISSEGPLGANAEAISFLQGLCEEAGCKTRVIEINKGYPMLLATIEGSRPELPSLLLNSHFDVVPVEADEWSVDPFAGHMDEATGDIYGRGTQDMKCVCIQYIEALRRLCRDEKRGAMQRTVHLSFMPDEEIGGMLGMKALVQTKDFKDLNVGVCLDEGLASEDDSFTVFYGERAIWWLMVRAEGPVGHASRFVKGNAMGKLIRSINQFLEYRAEQERLLDPHAGCKDAVAQSKSLGEVVTVNLTALEGGVKANGQYALNVVPMSAEAGFDIRIPPEVDLVTFEDKVKEWTKEEGVSYKFLNHTYENKVTSTDPESNPYWKVFSETCTKRGMKVNKSVFPAGTDGRFLRLLDIPVFGFSPMNNTPILLHDHNERLGARVFAQGVTIYEDLVFALANTPEA